MAENQSTVQKVSVLIQLLTFHTHTSADAIADRRTDRRINQKQSFGSENQNNYSLLELRGQIYQNSNGLLPVLQGTSQPYFGAAVPGTGKRLGFFWVPLDLDARFLGGNKKPKRYEHSKSILNIFSTSLFDFSYLLKLSRVNSWDKPEIKK